jgi:hypothetical protein
MTRREFLLARIRQAAAAERPRWERLYMRMVDASNTSREPRATDAIRVQEESWVVDEDLRQELDAVTAALNEQEIEKRGFDD